MGRHIERTKISDAARLHIRTLVEFLTVLDLLTAIRINTFPVKMKSKNNFKYCRTAECVFIYKHLDTSV